MNTALVLGGWFDAEGSVREAPRSKALWKQSQCYFQQAGRWLSLFQPGDQHFIFQTLKQPNSDISIQLSVLHIISRL